jgi:hypothetical protein
MTVRRHECDVERNELERATIMTVTVTTTTTNTNPAAHRQLAMRCDDVLYKSRHRQSRKSVGRFQATKNESSNDDDSQ